MRKIKLTAVIICTILLVMLWQQGQRFISFIDGILPDVIGSILWVFITVGLLLIWCVSTWGILTNYINKKLIQQRLLGLNSELGNIAQKKIVKYKIDRKTGDIFMTFHSRGVELAVWKSKQEAIESALDKQILSIANHPRSLSYIIIVCRDGRIMPNEEVLYDTDF